MSEQSKYQQGKQELWSATRAVLSSYRKGVRMEKVPRDGTLPLSFAQERVWFLEQLNPLNPVNNTPLALRLSGSLHQTALEQSIAEIVRRHEVLRTTIETVDGQAVQIISPDLSLTLPIADLRELCHTQREAEVQRQITEEAQQPFHLTDKSLFRVKLLRLDEEEHVLFLNMHHIISDGWCSMVFFEELTTLYEAFSNNQPSPLVELPIQYADFAVWQRKWLQGQVLESQLSYWKQQLDGSLPLSQLRTKGSRPRIQTYRGAIQSFEIPEDLAVMLRSLSQREGVTLFMTLLAAFQTLLYRYTHQEDIIVGCPIAGRNRVETKGLIGLLINTLVMRTNFTGNLSFLELLGRVKEVAIGAYAHQDLPFEKLVEELVVERSLSYTPLFQVMFVFQNGLLQTCKFPGLTLTPMEIHNGTARFDLTLEIQETMGSIQGWFEYNTDLFEADAIATMAEHFHNLLLGIVAHPEQHLWELPMLTPSQWRQPLVEWDDTYLNYLQDKCIDEMFKQRVEHTPNTFTVVEAFVAHRDELELQIKQIWEEVLNIKPISIKDNFFELGGHSFLAVRLFAQIEKRFGKTLPLATLFQAGTIEELANIIRQEEWLAPWSSLVAIQPLGSKPPLFYMHAGGGNLLVYRDLGFRMGRDQPVYGLQPRGLDGKFAPHTRIEDMADHYLALIRNLQPNGPYFLAGLSSGGLVALEMARQIRAVDQEVALLVLFDTYGPEYPKLLPLIPRFLSVLRWAAFDFVSRLILLPVKVVQKLREVGIKQTWNKILGKLAIIKRKIDEDQMLQILQVQRETDCALDECSRYSHHLSPLEKFLNFLIFFILNKSSRSYYSNIFVKVLSKSLNSLPETLQKIQAANIQAEEAYVAQAYPGRAILFRASQQPPGIYHDPYLGWGKIFSEGIEVCEIPGTHDSIVKSPILAEKLKACIERCSS